MVGQHIYKNSTTQNPYQKWIDTYSGKEFLEVVQSAIQLTDRVAEGLNKRQLPLIQDEFMQSTRLGLDFWDSAYRMKTWESEKFL